MKSLTVNFDGVVDNVVLIDNVDEIVEVVVDVDDVIDVVFDVDDVIDVNDDVDVVHKTPAQNIHGAKPSSTYGGSLPKNLHSLCSDPITSIQYSG